MKGGHELREKLRIEGLTLEWVKIMQFGSIKRRFLRFCEPELNKGAAIASDL